MNEPTPNRPRKSSDRQLSGMQILFVSILAIGMLLTINFSSRITETQRIQERYEELNLEIATLEAEQAALIVDRDYVQSDAYVEAWAREDNKMLLPDEVLIVPVPAGMPIPTPAPQATIPPDVLAAEPEEARATWHLWWALFFDSPPPM